MHSNSKSTLDRVGIHGRGIGSSNVQQRNYTEEKKERMQHLKQLKKRMLYEGMTKDEIRAIKKEKRSRKMWNKYKVKLNEERKGIQKQFFNSYFWNCFTHGTAGPDDDSIQPDERMKEMYTMQQLPDKKEIEQKLATSV